MHLDENQEDKLVLSRMLQRVYILLHICYDMAGRSVLDVSGAVVGPLTRAGP